MFFQLRYAVGLKHSISADTELTVQQPDSPFASKVTVSPDGEFHILFEREVDQPMLELLREHESWNKKQKEEREKEELAGSLKLTSIPTWTDSEENQETLSTFYNEQRRFASQVGQLIERLLRWRTGDVDMPFTNMKWLRISWSEDCDEWHDFPPPAPEFTAWVRITYDSESLQAVLAELIDQKMNMPLGLELLAEAIDIFSRSPRSSVVIGMSALEVALKEYIAAKIPDEAQWLAFDLPSPRFQDLLRNFPKIAGERWVTFPDSYLNELTKGQKLRNDIVHQGAAENPETLRSKAHDLFDIIRDVIWFLEWSKGFDWAWEFVRPEYFDGALDTAIRDHVPKAGWPKDKTKLCGFATDVCRETERTREAIELLNKHRDKWHDQAEFVATLRLVAAETVRQELFPLGSTN